MKSHIEHLQTTRASPPSQELSRLIAAAVVNKTFCDVLLTNPAQALQKGYSTEKFELSAAERSLVMAIHAVDIVDFAQQVANGKPSRSSHLISTRPASEVIESTYKRVEPLRPKFVTSNRSHFNKRRFKKRSAA